MGKQVWRGSSYPPQSELRILLVSGGAQGTGVEGVGDIARPKVCQVAQGLPPHPAASSCG